MNACTTQLKQKYMEVKSSIEDNFFLYYLHRAMNLTKDNLDKRNQQGSGNCCFCHGNEIIKHLFFEYRFASMIWGYTYTCCFKYSLAL